MKGNQAANRYAIALFDLAKEQNALDAAYQDMVTFENAVRESRELTVFLKSPIVSPDKKQEVFDRIFSTFQPLTAKFIALIVKNRREDLLPQIAADFIEMYKKERGMAEVTIVSAAKLDQSIIDGIIAKVKPVLPGQITIKEEINPDLIGGFIVRFGNTRIDASIAHQFDLLKQSLSKINVK
jgi:F-type H+-transporting ATPase subunit delta